MEYYGLVSWLGRSVFLSVMRNGGAGYLSGRLGMAAPHHLPTLL